MLIHEIDDLTAAEQMAAILDGTATNAALLYLCDHGKTSEVCAAAVERFYPAKRSGVVKC